MMEGVTEVDITKEVAEGGDETLDAAIGALEVVLNRHVDARLKTIEIQSADCLAKSAETLEKVSALLAGLEQAAEALKSHPLLASLMGGEEDGFNFG